MKKLFGLLTLLIVLLCGMAAAEAPAPVPTPKPTATPRWTARPRPTRTPRVTWTPRPTKTPVPTAVTDREGISSFINGIEDHDAAAAHSFPEKAQLLEIWFPVIAEADCALLKVGDETLMIDCGLSTDDAAIEEMMDKAGVAKVDKLIITHPHHDHSGAYRLLEEHERIGELYLCHDSNDGKPSVQFYWFAKNYGREVLRVHSGDVLQLGGAQLEMWMLPDRRADMNERSMVIRVSFGHFVGLFMADTGTYAEKVLLREKGPEWLACDFLRYPHHGGDALDKIFERVMRPKLSVLTTGKDPTRPGKYCARQISDYVAYTNRCMMRLATDGDVMKLEYITEYID